MLSTQDQGQSIILHVFWRQTRLVDDRVTADNGPKSFMCFEGVPNVHRLYDFLLNHRYVQHTILQQNVSLVCVKIL